MTPPYFCNYLPFENDLIYLYNFELPLSKDVLYQVQSTNDFKKYRLTDNEICNGRLTGFRPINRLIDATPTFFISKIYVYYFSPFFHNLN
jgi:hypothetical protein